MSVVRFRLAEAQKYRRLLETEDLAYHPGALRPQSAPAAPFSSTVDHESLDASVRTRGTDYIPVLMSYAQSLPARDDLPAATNLKSSKMELKILELTSEVQQLRQQRDLQREARSAIVAEVHRHKAIGNDLRQFREQADRTVDHEALFDARQRAAEQLRRERQQIAEAERQRLKVRFAHPSPWKIEEVGSAVPPRPSTGMCKTAAREPLKIPLPRRTPFSAAHIEELYAMRAKEVQRYEADENAKRTQLLAEWEKFAFFAASSHQIQQSDIRLRARIIGAEAVERAHLRGALLAAINSQEVQSVDLHAKKHYGTWKARRAQQQSELQSALSEGQRRLAQANEDHILRQRENLRQQWKSDFDVRVRSMALRDKIANLNRQCDLLRAQLTDLQREDEKTGRLRAETIATEQRLEYREMEVNQLHRELNAALATSTVAIGLGRMSAPLD
jgi:hypothetical protein